MLFLDPKIILKEHNSNSMPIPFLPSPGGIARGLRPIFGSLPAFWLKRFFISDVCSYTMGTIISLFRPKEHDTNSQLEEIDSKLKAQFESRLQVQRSRKKPPILAAWHFYTSKIDYQTERGAISKDSKIWVSFTVRKKIRKSFLEIWKKKF